MEAAPAPRSLSGEKAKRIVDAMRASVARRGAAGSTFDSVAREAGVSRGLLHYYFGSKEQLIAEVVRRDCELRMELLDAQIAQARTVQDFIDGLVRSLEDLVADDPDFVTLIFELFTLARRNEEIAAELAGLMRRTREQVAAMLAAKHEQGVLALEAEPDAVATVLFSLADGIALRMLLEPERDFRPALRAAEAAVRALLTGRV